VLASGGIWLNKNFALIRLMTAAGSTLAYTDALRSLLQSFLHGRLDYCNAVLIGTDEVTVERCSSFMSGS